MEGQRLWKIKQNILNFLEAKGARKVLVNIWLHDAGGLATNRRTDSPVSTTGLVGVLISPAGLGPGVTPVVLKEPLYPSPIDEADLHSQDSMF